MRLPRGRNPVGLFRRQVALRTRGIGIDGQPNHTFVRVLFLQVLHVAGAVMLFHKRTLWIKPLEHDIFALVL